MGEKTVKTRRAAAWAVLALFAGLCVFATAFAGREAAFAGAPPEVKTLSVDEGFALVEENRDNRDFVIVDVRTESEFRAGHLGNALNYDYNGETFREDIGRLDKNKTYFVYCRSGNRSGRAVEIMAGLGFTKMYNLGGGYAQWEEKGYPVVR